MSLKKLNKHYRSDVSNYILNAASKSIKPWN